jgi:predicted permease
MRLLVTDVRSAFRSLLKQPRFTLVASLTLALGVGAVTAIFSIVNGVLLKPLPYPNADRLVNIWSHAPKLGYDQFPLSPDLFFQYEKHARDFESMALYQARRANLTGDGPPEVVETIAATHTYFPTLGVQVAMGRTFSEKEDTPEGPRVVVISHRAWRDRFGSDPLVAGKVVRLDGEPTTIIGVAPAIIDQRRSPDFFVPMRANRASPIEGSFGWNAIGRLKPGVSTASASTELTALVSRLVNETTSPTYRAFLASGTFFAMVNRMDEDLVGSLQRPLWILLGTVGLLLVIACANVANLFLVRAEGRQLEVAVRVALGGSRLALVRAHMIEALTLALIGCGAGLALTALGLPAVLRLAPPTIPRLELVTMDWRVVLFAVAAAVVSALLFGIIPALRYTRPQALGALRHGGRSGTGDPARRRVRHALVIAQTAIALVLLVGSGLLARSFSRLAAIDPGFDPGDVMTFRIALPEVQYPTNESRAAFFDQLSERLAAIPGVERAGAATVLPIANSASGTAHQFDGQPIAPGALPPIVHYKGVAGRYFEAMRIPIVSGRDFHRGDFVAGTHNIIVNQALAEHYWPNQDPLGKRVRRYASDPKELGPWYSVIGVVGNERQDGLREASRPLLYYPGRDVSDETPYAFAFVVRGPGLTSRGDELRQAVWAQDRGVPVASMQTMTSIVDASIVEFTFTMFTLAVAAALALLLGAIGLYGVLSYAVTLRRREIGVRLALGATPRVVMRSIVATGATLAVIGLVLGLAGAAGLTRYMQGLLFETKPLDPGTFVAMSGALLAVAFLASYLPARRASHVSPLESMKAD